jgi:hypothetical protein
VVALGAVFEIFSLELYQSLSDYSNGEEHVRNPLHVVANELRSETELDFDIDHMTMTDQYRDALAELDTFIRMNFKLEEVYAVRPTRYR